MDELLTLTEAAALAGYTDPATLRQAIGRGSLSASLRIHNRRACWMVRRSELEAYIAARGTRNKDGRKVAR